MKNHTKIFWFIIFHAKFVDAKPMHIRFDKVDGFIRVYDGTKYLVLFGHEKYDVIHRSQKKSKKWYCIYYFT